ncbi:MAG: HlyD family secretion protein [Gammaproteobacteria bacterium]|nr:HlyD family secretion protein [Gammaproteobacteria bacterium]
MNYKKIFSLIGIFVFLAAIAGAYWVYTQYYISTDDAYLNANVVQVAPRVTGQVLVLDVQNNQYVKKGQTLFKLDPALFQVAIDQAQAQLLKDQAHLANVQVTTKRVVTLANQGVLSEQDRDNAAANLKTAQAEVALSQANLRNATLNMQYTVVKAPADGWVSNLSMRPQDTLNANESQFALISEDEFWVDANFKETDLDRIRVGATAKIVVDMYPNHPFNGRVESVSAGSGNAFALLPAQNATGNWVKVVQRVPVKIRVTDVDPHYPLRIGTSANVTIPTHG